jgi:secreted PhoX family phosphatase
VRLPPRGLGKAPVAGLLTVGLRHIPPYFPRENTVVSPGTGRRTVAMVLEDGPRTPDSQLYMYVGRKQRSGTVLERNGLVGGDLWVFASDDPARNSEATFDNGTVSGHWVRLADATNEVDQEAKADAAGAFGFVRIEDGMFGRSKKEFYFVSTGESADPTINRLGVNYRLHFNPNRDPEDQNPRLSVVFNTDQIDAANQDGPLSPDNITTRGSLEAIQEDGHSASRPEMANRGRDGSVWLVDGAFTSDTPTEFPPRLRIAELTGSTGGKIDPTPRVAGIWGRAGSSTSPIGGATAGAAPG